MSRLARVVVPDCPHHVTQCGNRRGSLFFREADREAYLAWMREYCGKAGLEVWAYCLMTNHVHLLVVPRREDSMAKGIGLAHRRFAVWQNERRRWQGHLWSDRYDSTPLDEKYLWTCVRYIERNPVRAGLVRSAASYPWSSARAHAAGADDPLLSDSRPFPGPVPDWKAWLATDPEADELRQLRQCTHTGRPCGSRSFVERISDLTGRILWPQKRGRKPLSAPTKREEGDLSVGEEDQ